MKQFLNLIMAAVALVTAIPSYAVTDKEMDQARAITAKHYLRYANNGSGYLDEYNPASMAELTKVLKSKEKENIQAFNAVAVPNDYASWDKAKLVEYWSSTFFKSPGLLEKGKECAGRLKSKLQAIQVSAPSAAPAEPAQEADRAETPLEAVDAAPAVADASEAEPVAVSDADADSLIAQAEADNGFADEQPRQSSHTGWYIAILAVLVAVVVWLVVYAARTMKAGAATRADIETSEREAREAKKEAKEQQNQMREQYASSLAGKNDEIKQYKARISQLEAELEAARAEVSRLKADASYAPQSAPAQSAAEPRRSVKRTHEQPTPALPPVVYLGQVNARGLFVKASRSLNPDSTVFRMDIPDGRNGSFMVVNDPVVVDRVLSDPSHWLYGGCDVENPSEADTAERIVTIAAGEALFADNTCRVVRKARIRYI